MALRLVMACVNRNTMRHNGWMTKEIKERLTIKQNHLILKSFQCIWHPSQKVLQLNEAGALGQANINFLRDSRGRIRVMGLGLCKPSLNRGKESFQITNFPENPSPKAWQTMFR